VTSPWKVVIVGGGFGGLARALRAAPVGMTMIDRRNYQLFQRCCIKWQPAP